MLCISGSILLKHIGCSYVSDEREYKSCGCLWGDAGQTRSMKRTSSEIMHVIMKVDHEADAQWGAAHSYCEKMTGVSLSSFFPAAPFLLLAPCSTIQNCELCENDLSENMSAG